MLSAEAISWTAAECAASVERSLSRSHKAMCCAGSRGVPEDTAAEEDATSALEALIYIRERSERCSTVVAIPSSAAGNAFPTGIPDDTAVPDTDNAGASLS